MMYKDKLTLIVYQRWINIGQILESCLLISFFRIKGDRCYSKTFQMGSPRVEGVSCVSVVYIFPLTSNSALWVPLACEGEDVQSGNIKSFFPRVHHCHGTSFYLNIVEPQILEPHSPLHSKVPLKTTCPLLSRTTIPIPNLPLSLRVIPSTLSISPLHDLLDLYIHLALLLDS